MRHTYNYNALLYILLVLGFTLLSWQAIAQQVYWTGDARLAQPDGSGSCNTGEILITVGFTIRCISVKQLKDDGAYQELVAKVQENEKRIGLLESNVKALASANDALTKRLERFEGIPK